MAAVSCRWHSAHFPVALPGVGPGQGFVFGDTLGFHAVAMVADSDAEPKAAIAQMAACLADGRGEIAPSVGERTAEVLAREVRHYLDCHTRPRDGAENGPDLLHLHARKAGDAMTVAHALGKVLANNIIPELQSSGAPELAHDSSTNALIRHYRGLREGG